MKADKLINEKRLAAHNLKEHFQEFNDGKGASLFATFLTKLDNFLEYMETQCTKESTEMPKKKLPDGIFVCPKCKKPTLTRHSEMCFDFVAKEMIVVTTCPHCHHEVGMRFQAICEEKELI